MLRAFACACTLIAAWSIALGVSSCSLVLDWNGYTGGAAPGADGSDESNDDASDARSTVDAPDVDARDVNTDAPDVLVVDAAPPCGPLNCGGCCNANGFCAGGESTATCGTGAEACQDCASKGQTCAEGKCTSMPPPSDSGPPPACVVETCMNMLKCIPFYQGACCKADGTCGCQNNFPPVTACN